MHLFPPCPQSLKMIVETLQQKTQTSTRTKRTGEEAGTEVRCQENFGTCKKLVVTDLEELRRLKFKLRREVSRIRSSRWILCCRTPTGVSLKMEKRGGTENRRWSWLCLCLRGSETPPLPALPRPPLPDDCLPCSGRWWGGQTKRLWIQRHQAQLRTGDCTENGH